MDVDIITQNGFDSARQHIIRMAKKLLDAKNEFNGISSEIFTVSAGNNSENEFEIYVDCSPLHPKRKEFLTALSAILAEVGIIGGSGKAKFVTDDFGLILTRENLSHLNRKLPSDIDAAINRALPTVLQASSVAPSRKLTIAKVKAYKGVSQDNKVLGVTLNCSASILQAFQNLMKGKKILGTSYINPYTASQEWFPRNVAELTARHLQILARNEVMNVTGEMNIALYGGLLSDNDIASIRALVKKSLVSGLVKVTAYGGYGAKKIQYANPVDVILIDQAGYQWQDDFRNTGGLFFYPTSPDESGLPFDYLAWQRQTYKDMFGQDRPENPTNCVEVNWRGVNGKLDLDELSKGFANEFLEALDAAVIQGVKHEHINKINFRFLKAGLGFFAEGVTSPPNTQVVLNKLEAARREGILMALSYIQKQNEEVRKSLLGKVKRIDLPFTFAPIPEGAETFKSRFEEIAQELGLESGEMGVMDAFSPAPDGYTIATTNCGDPHAMTGNEGGYTSVDAALHSNTFNADELNAAANLSMELRTSSCPSWREMAGMESSSANAKRNDILDSTEWIKLESRIPVIENRKNNGRQIQERNDHKVAAILKLKNLLESSTDNLYDEITKTIHQDLGGQTIAQAIYQSTTSNPHTIWKSLVTSRPLLDVILKKINPKHNESVCRPASKKN